MTLDSAAADGRIGRNPAAGIKLPAEVTRPMRFLEPDQIATLADSIGDHYRPFVLTAAYAGLRWGELGGLAVGNVDLLRKTMKVERQLQEIGGQPTFVEPKTRAGVRTVTLPSGLVEVLGVHFADWTVQESGLAFPTINGKPMRPSNFRKVWRRACTAAGFDGTDLDGFTIHELRHTSAA